MKSITILNGGISGIMLGLKLSRNGYPVSLVTSEDSFAKRAGESDGYFSCHLSDEVDIKCKDEFVKRYPRVFTEVGVCVDNSKSSVSSTEVNINKKDLIDQLLLEVRRSDINIINCCKIDRVTHDGEHFYLMSSSNPLCNLPLKTHVVVNYTLDDERWETQIKYVADIKVFENCFGKDVPIECSEFSVDETGDKVDRSRVQSTQDLLFKIDRNVLIRDLMFDRDSTIVASLYFRVLDEEKANTHVTKSLGYYKSEIDNAVSVEGKEKLEKIMRGRLSKRFPVFSDCTKVHVKDIRPFLTRSLNPFCLSEEARNLTDMRSANIEHVVPGWFEASVSEFAFQTTFYASKHYYKIRALIDGLNPSCRVEECSIESLCSSVKNMG